MTQSLFFHFDTKTRQELWSITHNSKNNIKAFHFPNSSHSLRFKVYAFSSNMTCNVKKKRPNLKLVPIF